MNEHCCCDMAHYFGAHNEHCCCDSDEEDDEEEAIDLTGIDEEAIDLLNY